MIIPVVIALAYALYFTLLGVTVWAFWPRR